jgi:NAD(P)H-hydrate epimerase
MGGAAALCGLGALRGGAGLVTVATADAAQAVVATFSPSYMTAALPSDAAGVLTAAAEAPALALAAERDILAVGPGLGKSLGVTQVVVALMARSQKPVVLDADGLNAVANRPEVLRRRSPLVLTPHPGEFARLAGLAPAELKKDREAHALRYAANTECILILKGAATLVTDGRRLYRNATGNPGMATGGTGDVLTGVVAALMAQGMDSFNASVLGVYVHGRAGDLARDELGEVSLASSDLIEFLPRAFKALAAEAPA